MTDALPHTALERARYGRRLGTGDRFVGFWLQLAIEGRNYPLSRDARPARRIVRRFYDKDAKAALAEAGVPAVHAQLVEAAQLYWGTCLKDSQYSSTMFGMKRLDDDHLRAKIADDFAMIGDVLCASGALQGDAAELPRLLLRGLLLAVPDLHGELRISLVRRPSVAPLVSDLLDAAAS